MNGHENLLARTEDFIRRWTGVKQEPVQMVEDLVRALKDVIVERDLAYGNFCQLRDDKAAEVLDKVTRVVVVPQGAQHQEFWANEWTPSLQDDARTLKLFAIGTGSTARAEATRALGADLGRLSQEVREGKWRQLLDCAGDD